MKTINLDYDTVKAGLLKLAEEHPDKVVTRCTYATPDGEPNCIVGTLFAEQEPEVFDAMRKYEQRSRPGGSFGIASMFDTTFSDDDASREVGARYGVALHADRATKQLLMSAQAHQDDHEPWRDAVDEAIRDAEARRTSTEGEAHD